MALVSQLLKCQPAVSLKHNILVHPNDLHEVEVLLYSWKVLLRCLLSSLSSPDHNSLRNQVQTSFSVATDSGETLKEWSF